MADAKLKGVVKQKVCFLGIKYFEGDVIEITANRKADFDEYVDWDAAIPKNATAGTPITAKAKKATPKVKKHAGKVLKKKNGKKGK